MKIVVISSFYISVRLGVHVHRYFKHMCSLTSSISLFGIRYTALPVCAKDEVELNGRYKTKSDRRTN